jgi:5-methylcytosine-specific restriction endonuclease McrA
LQGYPEDWNAVSLAYRRRIGFICELCGAHAPDGAVHHIHPVSRGGDSDEENLLFVCRACHALEHPHLKEE